MRRKEKSLEKSFSSASFAFRTGAFGILSRKEQVSVKREPMCRAMNGRSLVKYCRWQDSQYPNRRRRSETAQLAAPGEFAAYGCAALRDAPPASRTGKRSPPLSPPTPAV